MSDVKPCVCDTHPQRWGGGSSWTVLCNEPLCDDKPEAHGSDLEEATVVWNKIVEELNAQRSTQDRSEPDG